jgi:hypothetical protein
MTEAPDEKPDHELGLEEFLRRWYALPDDGSNTKIQRLIAYSERNLKKRPTPPPDAPDARPVEDGGERG